MLFRLQTFVAVLAFAGLAWCQDEPAADVPGVDPELPRVYIPSDQLDAVFNRDKQGVVLSRDEFRKLYATAKAADEANPRPPAKLVGTEASYVARISGQHLLITASLKFKQFVDEHQQFSIPLRGLSVEKATLANKPAHVTRSPGDANSIIVLNDIKGDHTLTLELSAPLAAVGSDKLVAFGLPKSPVAELSLTLPAGKHLIANSVSIQRPAAADQPADYKLALGGKDELTLRITEQGDQQVTDALVFANTNYVLDVAPGELSWLATTRLNVFGKPLDRLVFSVPKHLEIADVQSTGLEAWRLDDSKDGDRIEITLDYRQPFQDARSVTLKGIATIDDEDGKWTVPELTLANATSHNGRVVVRHPLGTRLRQVEASGVRTSQVERTNREEADRGTRIRVFDAWQQDFVLTFETQPKERELLAGVDSLVRVNQNNVELQATIQLATLYAPLFEFEVDLPADWTIDGVLVNNARVEWRPLIREAGLRSIRVELPQPLQPQQTAQVVLTASRLLENWDADAADAKSEFQLPHVDLPGAGVSDGSYSIRADSNLDVVAEDVRGLEPVNRTDSHERAAFRYQDAEFDARVVVSRKPSQVTTETLLHTRLDQDALRSHIECAVDINGGGLRNLEVAVSAVVKDVRFEMAVGRAGAIPDAPDVQIVEQKFDRVEQLDGQTYRVWKLRFDRLLIGRHVIVADIEVSRDAFQVGVPNGEDAPKNQDAPKSGRPAVPKLRVLGAERESGFLAIEASGDQQLTLSTSDHNKRPLGQVDPVDVIDCEAGYVPRERIVATYRFVNGNFDVVLEEARFDKAAVPTAVCHSLEIKSVLSTSGDIQNRATASLSAIGVQGVRVQLPENAELLSTLLDAEPVVVRKVDGKYFVPLSGGDSSGQRSISLFYRTEAGDLKGTGHIDQRPPQLTVDVGGTEQPLEVLDQTWDVAYPGDLSLTDSSGRFEPSTPLARTDLLSFFKQSLSIPTANRATRTAFALAFFSLIIAAFWATYRKWHGKGVIGLGVVAGIGLLLVLAIGLLQQPQYSADSSVAMKSASPASMASGNESAAMDGFKYDADMYEGSSAGGYGMGWEKTEAKPESAKMDKPMSKSRAQPQQPARTPQLTQKPGGGGFGGGGGGFAGTGFGGGQAGGLPGAPSPQVAPPAGSGRFGRDGSGGVPLSEEINSPRDEEEGGRMTAAEQTNKSIERLQGRIDENQEVADNSILADSEVADLPHSGRVLSGRGESGSRLSINIDIDEPEGHASQTFHYRGIQTADAGGLRIGYQSRQSGSVKQVACLLAVLCFFWWVRNSSTGFRAILGVLAFAVPLALIGVLPVGTHSLLQGAWLGAVCGLTLWLGRAACGCVVNCCNKTAQRTHAATTIATMILFMAIGSSASAQPETVPGSPDFIRAQQARYSDPFAANAVQPDARIAGPRVVIPYEPGTDPLASERVFLSRSDFLSLWNKAHPEQRIKANSPVEGLVTAATFTAKLLKGDQEANAQVEVQGRLLLHSFRDRQVVLELPIGVVALDNAQLNGNSATLTIKQVPDLTAQHNNAPNQADNAPNPQPAQQQAPSQEPTVNVEKSVRPAVPRLHVVLDSSGAHVLDVRFKLPAKLAGPAGQFTIPLLPVASGRLSFELPQADLNVRINGASSIFRLREIEDADEDAPRQLVEVATDRGGQLTMSWQPAAARGAVDSVVIANGSSTVFFADSGIKWVAGYDVDIRQGSMSDITFTLPEPLKIQGIAGADVGGWEVVGNGVARTVRVFLRRKVEDKTGIYFLLHHPLSVGEDSQSVSLPEFGPKEVTRETVVTGLFAEEQFVVRPHLQAPAQVNATLFTESSRLLAPSKFARPSGPPKFAYRFTARPFGITANIERRKPETEVTAIHGAKIEPRKIRWTSLLRFHLKGAPRSRLAIYLPDEYVLLSADSQYMDEWFPHESDLGRVLIIELSEPRLGIVEATLQGTVSREPNSTAAELWVPEALDVDKAETKLAVWVDEAYSAVEGELDGWRSVPPSELSSRHRSIYSKKPQFALSTDVAEEPAPLFYELTRIAPRVKADVLSVINLTEVSTEYSFNVRWHVQSGMADQFAVTAPSEFSGKLKFSAPGIRQVKESNAGAGRNRWVMTLGQPVPEGATFFAQGIITTAPVNGSFKTPTIDVQNSSGNEEDAKFTSLGKESQRQFVVLVNQSRDVVEPVNANLVEVVDDSELPQQIAIPTSVLTKAAAKFRLRSGKDAPEWNVLRRKADAVVSTVIQLATFKTVIAADGSWRTLAAYTMSNQARQFLAVSLPKDSRLLTVVVRGKASRAVTSSKDADKKYLLIPLPVTSATDSTFDVAMIVAGKSDDAISTRDFQVLGQKLELPAPHVPSKDEDANWGVSVLRTLWNVCAPDDWNVTVDKNSGWTDVSKIANAESNRVVANVSTLSEKFKVIDNSQSTPRQRFDWYSNAREALDEAVVTQQATSNDVDLDRNVQELQRQVSEFETGNTLDVSGRNAFAKDELNFNNYNLDARGQRLNVEQQNRDLLTSNAPSSGELQKSAVTNGSGVEGEKYFNFRLESKLESPANGAGDDSSVKPDEGKSNGKGRGRADNGQADANSFRQSFRNRGPQMATPAKQPQTRPSSGNMGGTKGDPATTPFEIPTNQPGRRSGTGHSLFDDFANNDGKDAGGAEETPEDAMFEDESKQAEWSAVGGLSLDIDLPTSGQVFSFSRMSAAQSIELAIQPRESANSIFGGIWAAVFAIAGLAGLVMVNKLGPSGLMKVIPVMLTVFGLLAAFAFPNDYMPFGLLIFFVGLSWLAVNNLRETQPKGHEA